MDESLKEHSNCIYNLRYDELNSIVTSSKDGKILLFDIKEKKIILKNEILIKNSPIYSMDLNGYNLIFGNKNKNLEIRDLRKFEKTLKNFDLNLISTHLKFNEISTKCLIGNEEGIKILNLKNFEFEKEFKFEREFSSALNWNQNYIISGTNKKGEIKIFNSE